MAEVSRLWVVLSWVVLALGVLVFASVEQHPELGPFPDAQSYAGLAESLADGDGYRIDIEGEPEGSRYSPGLPFVLAPMTWVMDVHRASVLLGVIFAVVLWAVAWRIGGPIAATVALLQLLWSWAIAEDATYVMADIPAALFTLAALWAVVERRDRLAGVLVGFSAWVRVAQAMVVLGLRRRGWLPFVAMIAGLAVTKVLWGWGYLDGQAEWSVGAAFDIDELVSPYDHQFPNAVAYPAMLLGLHGGLLLPGAAVAAAAAVWRRSERRFVFAVVLTALATYVPYFYQDVRFLFPAAAVVMVYAGAWVAELAGRSGGEAGERRREVAARDA